MQTILIPTDFSQNALMAADFAVNHLGTANSRYVLIHVYDIPHGGTSGLFYLMDEIKKQAEQDMEAFTEKLNERFKERQITFESRLAQGDFSEQSTILAFDENADCLVMGTKGASGVKEVLIGSSTVSMMRALKHPLFVIPEHYLDKDIEEVIISYDGKSYPEKAAETIKKYALKHDFPIRALHVRINEEGPLQNWDQLKALFDGFKIDIHECYGENYEEGLKKGIEDQKGLLVLLRHKQTFWERFFNASDSRKAVMHADLPVLVIPE